MLSALTIGDHSHPKCHQDVAKCSSQVPSTACCLQPEKAKEAPDNHCLCAMISLVELLGWQDQPSVTDCSANQVAFVSVALKPFLGPAAQSCDSWQDQPGSLGCRINRVAHNTETQPTQALNSHSSLLVHNRPALFDPQWSLKKCRAAAT